ncbi:MAG: Uma2 family endonuclease [Leptospiraceae bacterium]|nr:Uma2 family endonuclease [Leptospiraceae bacterium]
MDNLARKYLSEEEYLQLERSSSTKNEFYKGEIFSMAGAKKAHNLITTNLIREISLFFKGNPCEVYPSDMKVYIPYEKFYTYPDVTVVCENSQFLDENQDVLLNPNVIFEVLSESTEKYDRGAKFALYRKISSLKEYVLVSSEEKKMESFLRQENHWLYYESQMDKPFVIHSLGLSLNLEDIYEKVELGQKSLH